MTSRGYAVGLPVIVTVHDDGKVEYEIDTSEAGSGYWEAWSQDDSLRYDEEQIRSDVAAIDADLTRSAAKRTVWSLLVTRPDGPPVVSLHDSEEDAIESLDEHYSESVERESDSLITDLEDWGYTVTIDSHEV